MLYPAELRALWAAAQESLASAAGGCYSIVVAWKRCRSQVSHIQEGEMMKKALALLALTASCSAPSVTIVPAAIENSLTGSISGTTGGGVAGSNDLDSIGLGESEIVFTPKVDLNFLSSEISISTSSTSFAGSGTLDAEIEFDGEAVGVGTDVDTEMDVTATSVLWTFNFVNTDTAHFGLGLGLSGLDFDLAIQETGNPLNSTTSDEVLPVPLIGLRAGGDLGPVRLEASYATLQVDADGGEIAVNDLDIYAGLDVFGDSGSVVVGYRSFDVDASYDDGADSVALELGLGGPYLGVRLGF